jgi:hypothetical protein
MDYTQAAKGNLVSSQGLEHGPTIYHQTDQL